MTYAFLTDGMDDERREEFDKVLLEKSGDTKAKAARERDVVKTLFGLSGVKAS